MIFRDLERQPKLPSPPDEEGIRPSPGLEDLLASLARLPAPVRVLDLAPVDEKNLVFLGERGFKVQIAALDPDPGGRLTIPDYEADTFHAILAWDYLIRVDEDHRAPLAEALRRWLAPGGELFLILPNSSRPSPPAYRFRIRGPGRLEYRKLGPSPRAEPLPTREVLALFPDLDGTGARVLRQGSREFLLRRRAEGGE